MAKRKVRSPIAVCSSIGALLVCAVGATVLIEQVQADAVVGQCDGAKVTQQQYCTFITDCEPVGQCISYGYACSNGSCGPMGQQCARANFSDSVKVGQCAASYWESYTCASCTTYWCAHGMMYTASDSNGVCINYKCDFVSGVVGGCIPPS